MIIPEQSHRKIVDGIGDIAIAISNLTAAADDATEQLEALAKIEASCNEIAEEALDLSAEIHRRRQLRAAKEARNGIKTETETEKLHR